METNLHERNCAKRSCGRLSVASLNRQDLCLEHFLFSCYENLERLDPRGRSFSSHPVDLASMRAFIEECSRKALDISLHSENLLHFLKARLCRGRLLSCRWIAPHHGPSQKSDSPIPSTARSRTPRDRN